MEQKKQSKRKRGPSPPPQHVQQLLELVAKTDHVGEFKLLPKAHSRQVHVAYDSEKKPLVYLKCGSDRAYTAAHDYLAFLISHHLGFHAVPPTVACDLYPDQAWKLPLSGAVVQQAIDMKPEQQWPIEGDIRNKINKPLEHLPVDEDNVAKLILFHIVAGRNSCRYWDTVVDQKGRLWDVDNEKLGSKYTDCWLLSKYDHKQLARGEVARFLALKEDMLDQVWADFHPKEDQQKLRAQIRHNFVQLQAFLREHGPSPDIALLKEQFQIEFFTGFLW